MRRSILIILILVVTITSGCTPIILESEELLLPTTTGYEEVWSIELEEGSTHRRTTITDIEGDGRQELLSIIRQDHQDYLARLIDSKGVISWECSLDKLVGEINGVVFNLTVIEWDDPLITGFDRDGDGIQEIYLSNYLYDVAVSLVYELHSNCTVNKVERQEWDEIANLSAIPTSPQYNWREGVTLPANVEISKRKLEVSEEKYAVRGLKELVREARTVDLDGDGEKDTLIRTKGLFIRAPSGLAPPDDIYLLFDDEGKLLWNNVKERPVNGQEPIATSTHLSGTSGILIDLDGDDKQEIVVEDFRDVPTLRVWKKKSIE